MSRWNIVPCVVILCGLGLTSGCASRTAAATQSTVAAFDPAGSDPKAVEVVDQMLVALGGQAAWDAAKEIVWSQAIIADGKVVDYVKHSWDKWNGRHQYWRLDPVNAQVGVVMHELYGTAKYAYVQGEKGRAAQMKEDTARMAGEASRRLALDGYRLLMPYKLKDPGVHLAFSEERPAIDATTADAPMVLDVVKVTFDSGVGPASGDTYYVVVEKETKMPIIIEHVPAGRPDEERGATKLDDWTEAGGLKFPTKFTNLGYTKPDAEQVELTMPQGWTERVGLPAGMKVPKPGELVIVKELKVSASPDDDLYIPDVTKM